MTFLGLINIKLTSIGDLSRLVVVFVIFSNKLQTKNVEKKMIKTVSFPKDLSNIFMRYKMRNVSI